MRVPAIGGGEELWQITTQHVGRINGRGTALSVAARVNARQTRCDKFRLHGLGPIEIPRAGEITHRRGEGASHADVGGLDRPPVVRRGRDDGRIGQAGRKRCPGLERVLGRLQCLRGLQVARIGGGVQPGIHFGDQRFHRVIHISSILRLGLCESLRARRRRSQRLRARRGDDLLLKPAGLFQLDRERLVAVALCGVMTDGAGIRFFEICIGLKRCFTIIVDGLFHSWRRRQRAGRSECVFLPLQQGGTLRQLAGVGRSDRVIAGLSQRVRRLLARFHVNCFGVVEPDADRIGGSCGVIGSA